MDQALKQKIEKSKRDLQIAVQGFTMIKTPAIFGGTESRPEFFDILYSVGGYQNSLPELFLTKSIDDNVAATLFEEALKLITEWKENEFEDGWPDTLKRVTTVGDIRLESGEFARFRFILPSKATAERVLMNYMPVCAEYDDLSVFVKNRLFQIVLPDLANRLPGEDDYRADSAQPTFG